MGAPLPVSQLSCTQCGGELHPDEGQIFITCPFCSSTVYIDKSQVVFHWYLASTLNEADARASLGRWMAGNQTVKDLDKKARLVGQSFQYFPLWYFKRRQGDGGEWMMVEPAAATSISEIKNMKLPAGDLRKYDESLDPQAQPPTVPLQTALDWLEERRLPGGELSEQSLVHVPLYTFKYEYLNHSYTAVVEGATGEVYANIYPAKAEVPYRLIGLLTAAVFVFLATFPVIGALFGRDYSTYGLAACLSLGLLAAPFLFALAAWVAAKV